MNNLIDTVEQEIISFLENHQNPEMVQNIPDFLLKDMMHKWNEKDLLPSQQKIWTKLYVARTWLNGFLDLETGLSGLGNMSRLNFGNIIPGAFQR